VLNFGLARERYSAEHPEISDVRMVVVGDDVAVGKTQSAIVGRRLVPYFFGWCASDVFNRGLAGTVMVYKIAGALAAEGATLDRVSDVAQYVAGRVGTIGISAEHVHVSVFLPEIVQPLNMLSQVPGTALGESALSSEEVEIGKNIRSCSMIYAMLMSFR
jgi:dihydroxyacetone kinase